MEISFEKIKELMEKYNYFAEDELIWQTYININKFLNGGQVGQNVHAICLEGPPGSGKTEYAKIYRNVLKDILGEDVELITYQCDSTTGKAELFEEIRVAAAIAGNPDEVIIAGKLVEAIDSVNNGKKVILFLDEYDKAREETDAFLLQFLQEGKINTTQRGDVEILPENLGNIHVILCKNQMRDELSGPLERRVKIIRLTEMKPTVFYEVAQRQLPNANPDILNAVSVLYGKLYDNKDEFARIPSCSELLMAIQDACTLIKAKAPREYICSAIISNILKNPNDIETFKFMLSKDESLADFFKGCCEVPEEGELTENEKLRRKLLEDFFSEDIKRISQEIEIANKQIHDINVDHQYLEGRIEQQSEELKDKDLIIQEQQDTIKKLLAGAQDVDTEDSKVSMPEYIKVGDNHKFVRTEGVEGEILDNSITLSARKQMDKSVFDFSEESWSEIGYAVLETLRNKESIHVSPKTMESLCDKVLKYCDSSMVCKDGFVIYNEKGFTIIGIRVLEEKQNENGYTNYVHKFKFFSNKLAMPIYALYDLANFTHEGCYHGLDLNGGNDFFLECLVTGEEQEKSGDVITLEEISENFYHLTFVDRRRDLEDASRYLQTNLNLSDYFSDKYERLRRSLERLAITKHREMIIDGKIKPEYVLPINEIKGFDSQDDGKEK